MDALWGEDPPRSAHNGVQVYVSRLRNNLSDGAADEPPLVTHGGGYVLHVPTDAVDAERFERLLATGRDALHDGDPVAAERTIDAALALWRGPPFADFGSDSFARAEIARLEELRLLACEARVDALIALGRSGEATAELHRLIDDHPFEERLREQLMLALYRSGRQADALAVYREFRRVIVAERALEPGAALRRLEAQILRQEAHLDDGAQPLRTTKSEPVEERKTVTVLVASLRRPESGARDPEEVRARVEPLRRNFRREIEKRGGAIEAFVGETVTAVFGAPASHEDDPERAVQTALALRELARSDGGNAQVGVATGEAIVALYAPGAGILYGDVVHEAARLEAGAPADAVVLDRRTSEAVDGSPSRSSAEGVITLAPLSARSARLSTPFVGRAPELAHLLTCLDRVQASRTPELVTVIGEPGIGKSRLVEEAKRMSGEGETVRWLRGRSIAYGDGISSLALSELVKAHAGIGDADTPDGAAAKLAQAVASIVDEPERDWLVTHLHPLLGMGKHREEIAAPAEAGAARRRFFAALAEERPLVLVFEDVHLADDGVLDFVEGLVEWVRRVPLLILATARPDLVERRPAWAARAAAASRLDLAPLADDDTKRLVARLFDLALLDGDEQRSLLEAIGGNPLFAEQFALMLRDGDARYRVPDTVLGVIAARIDDLPADEKRLLQNAAIFGPRFSTRGLAELGGVGLSALERLLNLLVRRELIEPVEPATPEGDEYRFRHALVRDVAYGQVPRARRAERHERAAAWLELHERHDDWAELLAYHYGGAIAHGGAELRSDLAPRARDAFAAAGARAGSLHAWALAASHYERALDLTSAGDPLWPELELGAGEALLRQGTEGGMRRLERAMNGLLATGARERAAEAATLLADAAWYAGLRDRCFGYLDQAVQLVREGAASQAKARVLNEVARHRLLAGDSEAAIDHGREALSIARRLSLPDVEAHALVTVGTARGVMEDLDGIAEVERGLALALAHGSLAAAARAYHNLFVLLGRFADPRDRPREQALRRDALDVAQRLGDRQFVRFHATWQIQAAYDDGDWNDAARAADTYLAECDSEPHANEVVVRIARAEIRHARDDAYGALKDVERALVRAREAKAPQWLYPTLAAAARLYEDLGRVEDARLLLNELLAEDPAHAMREANAALVAADLGRHDAIQHAVVAFPRDAWTPWRRALADGRLGDAAELAAKRKYPVLEAHVRLRAARAALAEGLVDDAQMQVLLCGAFFARVGGTRYVRLAGALRGRP